MNDELDDLLDALFDYVIDDAGCRRLDELLCDDEAARHAARRSAVHGQLQAECAALSDGTDRHARRRRSAWPIGSVWSAIAAAGMVIATIWSASPSTVHPALRVDAAVAAPRVDPEADRAVLHGFAVIDADTGRPVRGYDPIAPDAVLTLTTLPPRISIIARAEMVREVDFVLVRDGMTVLRHQELVPPYTLCGDTPDQIEPWQAAPGRQRLVAIVPRAFADRGDATCEVSFDVR